MIRIEDTTTPVVIIQFSRGLAHGGLGAMRSLGRLGVSVYAVNGDSNSPSFSSRYCRGGYFWDLDRANPERTAERLCSMARQTGRRPILLATTEDAAIFVAENTRVLEEAFIFPDRSPSLIHSLASKKEMYYLAKRLGVPTAETSFPQNREDVLEFLEQANFPIMLKGIDGLRLRKRTGVTMVIVRDKRELLERYDAMEEPGEPNLMLQEYLPGGDDTIWMFNGYFNKHSECLLGITGKKIRQHPIYTGSTSLGIALPNEAVAEATKNLMKAIGYQGILDIGYRYDARDGLYKVLDINPRLGGTFRLFVTENGMDVVRALYLDLTGQPVPSGDPVWGRKWMVEDADCVSCFRYFKDGKLSFKEWVKSYRGLQEGAYFAWDDLRPCRIAWSRDIRRLFRQVFVKSGGRAGSPFSRRGNTQMKQTPLGGSPASRVSPENEL